MNTSINEIDNAVMPQVVLLAETAINEEGVRLLTKIVGAPDWQTDAPTGSEKLVEIMGRLCYKSFAKGLNPNVTRVREGNQSYIENILKSKHGSVLEHATVTLALLNVSRVVTHEVVRHRAGTAFSQESLRYVRLEEINYYYPSAFNHPDLTNMQRVAIEGQFKKVMAACQEFQKEAARIFKLDSLKDFTLKKLFTSAMRRGAPIGLATSIGVTANHRAWRHMIAQRSSVHAEEEIKCVFYLIGALMKERYPNLYQDMYLNDGGEWVFENDKI